MLSDCTKGVELSRAGFHRSSEQIDYTELKLGFEFGRNAANRGHDGNPTPIIDANRLFIFLIFA